LSDSLLPSLPDSRRLPPFSLPSGDVPPSRTTSAPSSVRPCRRPHGPDFVNFLLRRSPSLSFSFPPGPPFRPQFCSETGKIFPLGMLFCLSKTFSYHPARPAYKIVLFKVSDPQILTIPCRLRTLLPTRHGATPTGKKTGVMISLIPFFPPFNAVHIGQEGLHVFIARRSLQRLRVGLVFLAKTQSSPPPGYLI